MQNSGSLYEQVVTITEDYLGPAGPRFLTRIATNHLGKPATRITSKDLPELITWVQLAASMITENSATTEQFVRRLRELEHFDGSRSDVSSKTRQHETAK